MRVETLIASALLASTALAGTAIAQTAVITPLATTQTVEFSIILPLQNTTAMQALLKAQQTPGSASYHKWLSPAQVAAQFGPSLQTIAKTEEIATAAGLHVVSTHIRSIDVTGTAAQAHSLLATNLGTVATSNGGTRIVSSTKPAVPASLSALGAQVLNFSTVRERQVHSHVLATTVPASRNGAYGGYYYNDMKQAYDYPSFQSLTGAGTHVAIVMENTAKTTDITAMFLAQKYLTTTGKTVYPTFTQYYTQDCYSTPPAAGLYTTTTKLVAGCKFNANEGSDEASLDTQMVLGGAPGASVSLVTIPDLSDSSILDSYIDIIESNQYDIVSNSFGGCELDYLPSYNNGYDFTPTLAYYSYLFQVGSMEGITWIFSSGDEGGLGCPSIPYIADETGKLKLPGVFVAGVETPAADPNVTAVGGGNLQTTFISKTNLTSTYVGENGAGDPELAYDVYGFGANVSGGYWGATGGYSVIFGQPSYQTAAITGSSSFRAVPDIGMQVGGCPGGISESNCPEATSSYVEVYVSNKAVGLIGTSVSAPEFAGALALAEQYFGSRQGNINPALYALYSAQIAAGGANAPPAKQYYHMNIAGYDGVYTETANGGWNAIYGPGSPDVRVLFGMTTLPAAGTPETASNP